MKLTSLAALALTVCSLVAAPALAGAPLKGVDVKLGKNPGGSPAAREGATAKTDAQGTARFNGLAPSGYQIVLTGNGKQFVIDDPRIKTGTGGAGQVVVKEWAAANRTVQVAVEADTIKVTVTEAKKAGSHDTSKNSINNVR